MVFSCQSLNFVHRAQPILEAYKFIQAPLPDMPLTVQRPWSLNMLNDFLALGINHVEKGNAIYDKNPENMIDRNHP